MYVKMETPFLEQENTQRISCYWEEHPIMVLKICNSLHLFFIPCQMYCLTGEIQAS